MPWPAPAAPQAPQAPPAPQAPQAAPAPRAWPNVDVQVNLDELQDRLAKFNFDQQGMDWQDWSDKVQKQVEKAQEQMEKAQEKAYEDSFKKYTDLSFNYNFNALNKSMPAFQSFNGR